LKLINTYKNVNLVISEQLISEMAKEAEKFYPNEIGGFLIGYYSLDLKTVYLTNFILPKKYKNGSHLFERSIDGLTNFFKNIFKKNKQYYIGEWHTHPNGSPNYSNTDLKAMKEIASNDKVIIENPILLILSVDNKGKYDFSFYLYANKKLIKYDKN